MIPITPTLSSLSAIRLHYCRARLVLLAALAFATLAASACGGGWSSRADRTAAAAPALPPAAALSADDGSETAIRFLEGRVGKDPDDFAAQNRLAAYYLLRVRETGNVE